MWPDWLYTSNQRKKAQLLSKIHTDVIRYPLSPCFLCNKHLFENTSAEGCGCYPTLTIHTTAV